jgi:hypothetical protein
LLLKNDSFDWFEEYRYERGVAFPKYGGRGTDAIKPLPEISDSDKIEIKAHYEHLQQYMRPCTRKEFSVLIYRLSLHCGMKKISESEARYYADDLFSDLQEYPLPLLEAACEKWRKSVEEKTRFMPSSGDLIALVYEDNQKYQKLKKRMMKVLGLNLPAKQATKPSDIVNNLLAGMRA